MSFSNIFLIKNKKIKTDESIKLAIKCFLKLFSISVLSNVPRSVWVDKL